MRMTLRAIWRQMRADLAIICHWPPSELDALEWADLVEDHHEAIKRWSRMNAPQEGDK